MAHSSIRIHAAAALAGLALAACSSRSRPADDRPTIRLSPLEAAATPSADAARAVDRDTTTSMAVGAPTTLTLRFAHDVDVRSIRVNGAGVDVSGEGLGAWSDATAEGWRTATVAARGATRSVTLALRPAEGGGRLAEIEVWGAGAALAPRDPLALAGMTKDGTAPEWENARVLAATPAEATLQPGAGTATCLHAALPAFAPRQARRAYLAYEANLPRAVALQSSWNGEAPSQGLWLPPTAEARTLVAEVDPERLRGRDDLLLCLPADATAPVDVSRVRLLVVQDDGTDPFDREAHRAAPAALDGDAATTAAFPAAAREIGLDRALDVQRAEIRLGVAPARLRAWASSDGSAWTDRGALALDAAAAALPLAGRTAALRLEFEGRARADVPAASVAELQISGSGVGPRVGAARIVVTYPALVTRDGRDVGERFGDRALVRGWAESPAGPGAVEIDGARVDDSGAFSVPLRRAAGSTGSWLATVRARFPDGSEVTRTIALDDDRLAEVGGAGPDASASTDPRFGREDQNAWGTVDPATGGKVTLGTDVSIEAPPGAVSARTQLAIARKGREVIPHLEPGMVNVTAPAHAAYRFLPRGQKFAQPVQLTIPYDPELLPDGVAPEEVRTFYFDEAQDRWIALNRRAVRRETAQVVSETTHFTFMINAVLVLPDHPGPVSFNPNSIKDIKAADPSSGMDLIEPPTGNNEGTARLGFPVRLPKARGAYQPQLSISYDSTAGNGWLGVGWTLAVPSVEIDTRYGVPEYTGEERYLLQGEPIVPIDPPLSGSFAGVACVDGARGRRYQARVERDFREIVRCGEDPTRFWFQVTDKAGTLQVFGRDPNARLVSYLPRVTNPPSFPPVYDVARWYVERVVDLNGNLTEYGYQHDSRDPAQTDHLEEFREVYLRSIRYSGRASRTGSGAVEGGTSGPYVVELQHAAGARADVVTSGRAGFKTVVRRRLGQIVETLLAGDPSGTIRSYVLAYEAGDFGKSRLRAIEVHGADGALFYQHKFEYESKALPAMASVSAFTGPEAWVPDAPRDTGLSGSDERSYGFHGFVGLGVGPLKSQGAVGIGFGYSHRETKTNVATVDLNGDGLPDRVYGDHVLLSQGDGQRTLTAFAPSGDPAFRDGQQVPVSFATSDGTLGKEKGDSIDASLQVFGGPFALNFGGSYTVSKSKDFFLDANGDGYTDFIRGGTVFLNQPRSATCPPGTPLDRCCPAGQFCFLQSYPMTALRSLEGSSPLVDGDPTLAKANEKLAEAMTPEDAVLEWTAPFDGRVDVTGSLAWVRPPLTGDRHDGVRLIVYRYDPATGTADPDELATIVKSPVDTSATSLSLPSVRVHPGDTLYFVLSTLADFPFARPGEPPSPIEEVSFAPVITYLGATPDERISSAPTGAALYRFDTREDFSLAGEPPGSIMIPRDGKVQFTLRTDKKPTSDLVRFCVKYLEPDPNRAPDPPPPCRADDWVFRTLSPTDQRTGSVEVTEEKAVKQGGTFYVRMESDVAIDPRAVSWTVSGRMICVNDDQGVCRLPSDDERAALAFAAEPYFPLHDDVVPMSDTYRPSGLPLKPFIVKKKGRVAVASTARWSTRPSPIHFSVRTVDKSILKWTGDHVNVGGALDVDVGDQVFFEAHTESAASLLPSWFGLGDGFRAPDWTLACQFQPAPTQTDPTPSPEPCGGEKRFTTDRRAEGFAGGNTPVLAGGHHGWRFGAWQGKDGEKFKAWVFHGPPKTSDWDGDPKEVRKNQKNKMKDPNDPQRQRLRYAGLLAPNPDGTRFQSDQPGLRPGIAAFVSSDGNTFFTHDGTIHAGKKGQAASGVQVAPDGTVAEPVVFSVDFGRTSTAVNLSAGVGISVPGFSANIAASSGMSQQKLDVLDMNGDRIVDVVVAGGIPDATSLDFGGILDLLNGDVSTDVRLTSPVSLATSRIVRLPGIPKLNYDFSVNGGLGASEPIRQLMAASATTRGMAGRFPSVSGGVGYNLSKTVQDLVDVNGDGLPDAVRANAPGCAGLAVRLNLGTSFASREDCIPATAPGTDDVSSTLKGGVDGGVDPDDDDPDAARGRDVARGVLGGQVVRQSQTVTIQGSAGLDLLQAIPGLGGVVDGAEQFGVSVSAESSISATNVALVDVNGDGLPDFVYKGNGDDSFTVRINLGYGFGEPQTWKPEASWTSAGAKKPHLRVGGGAVQWIVDKFLPGAGGIDPIEATGTHSAKPSVGVVVGFAFPLLVIIPTPWVHISAGANYSHQKVTGFELGLMDIDGDGLPDHVLRTQDGATMWVRRNKLTHANLLKKVTRPLGGSFELAYERREGNTVDMPQSRWVLTNVKVHDGLAPAPDTIGHDFETKYEYADGRYDRIEREFLGFARVTRTNPDLTTVEQRFKNDNVLVKGLVESERMRDPEKRLWTETLTTYSDLPMALTPLPVQECADATPVLLDVSSWCRPFWTQVLAVERRTYEGLPQPAIATRQRFEYEPHGEVKQFWDDGDLADPADDLSAAITYVDDDAAATTLHSVARPRTVTILDRNGATLRSRSATYDGDTGNLLTFTALVTAQGTTATTDLEWYANGTLKKVTAPPNHRNQRYFTEYAYDDVTGTYMTSISDAHSYASTARYDLRFGEAIETTDVNGNVTARRFDPFGRLERLAGPYHALDAPTIQISYAHEAAPPYARTRNQMPRVDGDGATQVDTVVVMDGVGRVIQTKKSADMSTGEATSGLGWSVTGHLEFDAVGRVTAQGQTFAQFSARLEYVAGSPRNPTRFVYDVLGRKLQTVEPNGAVTRFDYGFAAPPGGSTVRHRETTTDGEGHVKVVYKDAADRVTEVEEHVEGRSPTTRLEHNAVGELVKMVDAVGNATTAAYDLMGRRTVLHNPDTGRIAFSYDLAGNLVARDDPLLRDAGKAILYTYDFDRLTDVAYPTGARNVHYRYGLSGGPESNGVGRIVEVSDDVGRETRGYDALGAMTTSTRFLRPLLPGDRERQFTTAFKYDSFGRMMWIVYPDGEKVSYGYDRGGLLQKAVGHRDATLHSPAEDETYVSAIGYDEFGQRVRMKLGNGVATAYAYDPLTRRLAHLKTVTPLDRTLQDVSYGYDRVGNVVSMVNALGEPVGDRSGAVSYAFRYDEVYRLSWAHGEARSRPHTVDEFTSSFRYSDIHNMERNEQLHEIVHGDGAGIGVERPPKTNHELDYAYAGAGPHQATKIGDTFLVYDKNGNTVRECRDHGDPTCEVNADHLRRFTWTEENRLDQVVDGGGRNVTKFFYDAAGERVAKLGRGGESVTIGQYWALKGRRAATKHVFAGVARVASKLLPPPGWDDTPPPASGTSPPPVGDGSPNTNGCDPSNYEPLKCPVLAGGDPVVNHRFDDTKVRPETYYYHPDHLGSTSWVTDQNGRVHEHVEYFPFGEVWRDPQSDADGAPVKGQRFLFTSKELDEETGLYYFGARYYDPVRAVWKNADPLVGQYFSDSRAQVSLAWSLYAYGNHNPLRFVDPDGRSAWDRIEGGMKLVGGVMEASAGAALGAATAWTGIGAVAGAVVVVHGADVAASGLRQLISGHKESTLTSQAMQAAGVSEQTAERIDTAISVVGSMGAGIATGVIRSGSSAAAGAVRAATAPFGNLSRAAQYGLKPYNQLVKVLKGTGLEAHHLIEKRFARVLGEKAREMMSVAITEGEHQAFTNAWRRLIPYGEGTATATKEKVLQVAKEVYKDYPEILKALGLQ